MCRGIVSMLLLAVQNQKSRTFCRTLEQISENVKISLEEEEEDVVNFCISSRKHTVNFLHQVQRQRVPLLFTGR